MPEHEADLPEMHQDQGGASPMPLLGALIAGLIGAAAWAAVFHYANYEIGWLAWGIGGLVGLGAKKCGGHGTAMGAAAAVITLASIFGGKLTGMIVTLSAERSDVETHLLENELTEEMLAEYQTDAADLAALGDPIDDETLTTFAVDHDYAEREDVTEDYLEFFRAEWIPTLEEFHTAPPEFEAWREQELRESLQPFDDLSPLELVIQDLNGIDFIFAAPGVMTAFRFLTR